MAATSWLAGFTIEEEKIPAFRARMNQCVLRFLDGRPVVSALDVDVVLRRPELVTLWEVEQLRRLEPYGSGNSRPLFCLLGVTLDRVQGVGQNRHLKLRFSKGAVQLEGIFFSVTTQQCPCQAGERVDVAFYLQVNEFRGQPHGAAAGGGSAPVPAKLHPGGGVLTDPAPPGGGGGAYG